MNGDVPDRRRTVAGGPDPGRNVGVMVEPGDDHLVTGLPPGGDRPRQGERHRRHVGSEDDTLIVRGAEQVGTGPAGLTYDGVRLPAAGEVAAVVGVVPDVVVADRVDDR